MFILTTISDLVRITPTDFRKLSRDAIEDNLNAKYANKVIQNIGLGICVFDVIDASDGRIGYGDGLVNVNVKFRLMVFRPFRQEIVVGKIKSSSEYGIKIQLDFFDDIHVPGSMLFSGSSFNKSEQCWVWNNNGDDYFFDKNEWVRCRIEQEHWHDTSPMTPAEREKASSTERQAPYSIIASMSESALGPVTWW